MLCRVDTIAAVGAIVGLLGVAIAIQVVRDRQELAAPDVQLLYVPSGKVIERLVLSFDALASDVYWIRAIQHYGGTKRSTDPNKKYHLLNPLLDLTTTLDPLFNIAYRFGAIFLAEPYPGGPGRPDQAVSLLKKGLAAQPRKWQYMQDIGFVYYWWMKDYNMAAEWFQRASRIEGAPWWLKTLAATTLAQGGDRAASRLLWEQLYETADQDWLRNEAQRRLLQLAALDDIDQLEAAASQYATRYGSRPRRWEDMIRARLLPGHPADPTGTPYVLSPDGKISVAVNSPLFPLPTDSPARVASSTS